MKKRTSPNGCFGLKPAIGYVHTEEIFSYFSGTGPMARSFEDMVLMYNVISGPAPESPSVAVEPEYPLRYDSVNGMKIAYLGGMGIVEPAMYVADAVKDAISVLQDQGAQVDSVDFDFEIEMPIFDIISKMAIGGAIGGMLKKGFAGINFVHEPTLFRLAQYPVPPLSTLHQYRVEQLAIVVDGVEQN